MLTDDFQMTCAAYGKNNAWIMNSREILVIYAQNLDRSGEMILTEIPVSDRETLARLFDVLGSFLIPERELTTMLAEFDVQLFNNCFFHDSMKLRRGL